MYVSPNFPTKKAFKEAVKAGVVVETFQPGGMFPAERNGRVAIEGPHYPKPHTWYASVLIEEGLVVKVLG